MSSSDVLPRAAGADDGSFRVWDLRAFQSGQPVAMFKWHKAGITSVEWSPLESSTIAVAGADNQVTLWDLALEEDPEAESAVSGLDDQDRTAAGARGMTVVTLSPHSTSDLATTLTWERFDEIVSANFTKYIRTFDEGTDLACFQTTECTWAQVHSVV